ncbi:hypothetical protein MSG28_008611 [Choristoneura fumiferana]|uniref:Uncharacterized protein n=1 Tax=Choristoneura fumiferana TaxID=7141 RepID=A0ACC0J7F2_CHOFU|nr:hypothetical protein MSG28_008611 [Choristoneura fumiferana]
MSLNNERSSNDEIETSLTITSMLTVVYSMLDDYGPWWFILAVMPFSLTGGFTVLITGAYCYVSDITTTDQRTFRMTLLEATFSAGSIVGAVMSSYLLRSVGNVYLLLIVTALYVIGYAFTNVYLNESLTGALREMINECFKHRPNNGRAQIILLTSANTLTIFILYGTSNLDYLYTREKLHWAMKEYSLYSGASASISFLRVISAPLIRSHLTKALPIEDIAKVFALLCAMESICPIIAPLVYNSLYGYTLDSFPGAFYVLSASINGLCVVLLGVVQYFRWNSVSYQPLEASL